MVGFRVRCKTHQALTLIVTELIFIVVEQPYRGNGPGSKLLRYAVAEAKVASIPFCVCSEPAARPLFDKHNFLEEVHADMDLSARAPPYTGFGVFRLTGMVWRPE
jgi:GNAT superfamily N-acetyltransferase